MTGHTAAADALTDVHDLLGSKKRMPLFRVPYVEPLGAADPFRGIEHDCRNLPAPRVRIRFLVVAPEDRSDGFMEPPANAASVSMLGRMKHRQEKLPDRCPVIALEAGGPSGADLPDVIGVEAELSGSSHHPPVERESLGAEILERRRQRNPRTIRDRSMSSSPSGIRSRRMRCFGYGETYGQA